MYYLLSDSTVVELIEPIKPSSKYHNVKTLSGIWNSVVISRRLLLDEININRCYSCSWPSVFFCLISYCR